MGVTSEQRVNKDGCSMAKDEVETILGELGITPEQILGLTGNQRSRLLNFLLRWEHLGALSVCLDALIPPNPTLVSESARRRAGGDAEAASPQDLDLRSFATGPGSPGSG